MNKFRNQFIRSLAEAGPLADMSGGQDPNMQAAPGALPEGELGVQDPSLQQSLAGTKEAGDTPDPITAGLPQWAQLAKEMEDNALKLLSAVKVAAGKPGGGKIWGRAANLLGDIRSKLAALGSEFETTGETYSVTKAEVAKQGQ
jgi:hypothetical protein